MGRSMRMKRCFAIFKVNLVCAQKYQLKDQYTASYSVIRFSDLTHKYRATSMRWCSDRDICVCITEEFAVRLTS
ncbi:hypothetical protein EG68_11451 [Paragonimus skrjabini miyazakii]|uniref:Secreted protein n=1 Tax=Paragonimus skrjabini miyazakii TaxID=59628 RepID=A0A8S9YDQ9_9TREM|nr:hypothetical protein EG68_11451 [Paragonimus skrjabini miyazakii]